MLVEQRMLVTNTARREDDQAVNGQGSRALPQPFAQLIEGDTSSQRCQQRGLTECTNVAKVRQRNGCRDKDDNLMK